MTVEMSAKCHLSQNKTSLFTATNVFQNTNHNVAVQDLAEIEALDLVVTEAHGLGEETDKCFLQPAVTVEMSAKCHSNQKMQEPFTAMNVFQNINKTSNCFRIIFYTKMHTFRIYFKYTDFSVIQLGLGMRSFSSLSHSILLGEKTVCCNLLRAKTFVHQFVFPL